MNRTFRQQQQNIQRQQGAIAVCVPGRVACDKFPHV